MRPHPLLAVMAACLLTSAGPLARGDEPAELKPLLNLNFDAPDALAAWTFTDPAAWRLTDEGVSGKALELFQQSKYTPEVRSPVNYALYKDLDVADFDLEIDLQQTGREYGHRDLCLFFGFQDPSHFYYVHLATAADPHAHSIFLVNGEPRVSIAQERTDGVAWTDGWHKARIKRRVDSGLIEVYFDDMTKPIMTTKDTTFTHGRIGVGTFDDTGRFDNLILQGQPAPAAP